MRQDQAIEIASQDAAISQVVADPSVATTPSQNETTSYRKAIYTAFETYPNVMVMDVSTIRSGGTCYSSMLVCTDKLQVYNTLGATYGKPGFTPLSEPFNYKPYGTR